MIRIYIFIALFTCFQPSFCQEILWSKKISPVPVSTTFVADNYGNLYDGFYTINNNFPSPDKDTIGYVFQKIDTSGSVVFQKRYKLPFYINKMVFDNQNNIFFTGLFYGNLLIDGIQLQSKGGYDGMVGKMDSNGKLIWVLTFGGKGDDAGNGICLNVTKNSVLVTGGSNDSVYVNSNLIGVVKQAIFIGEFSINGAKLIKSKLFDYYPTSDYYGGNYGKEIQINKSGSVFLLERRRGKYFQSNEPIEKYAGDFLSKLNFNFDTLWSKRIGYISQNCQSGSKLSFSENGDIFLLVQSSYYRGGSGQLLQIDTNGVKIWHYELPSVSEFSDLLIRNRDIFITGKGGRTEFSQPIDTSYSFIKKFRNHIIIGETRFKGPDGYGYNLALNSFSDLYLRGSYSRPFIINKDSLNTQYDVWQGFISRIRDVNCTPVTTISKHAPFYGWYYLCPGGSSPLSASSGFINYEWSDGQKGKDILIAKPGHYTVKATNANGCNSYSYFVDFGWQTNQYANEFSSVGYDPIKKRNVFRGISANGYGYKYLDIYKQIATGKWVVSDTGQIIFNGNQSMMVDRNSDPNTGSIRYYISSVDTCGLESPRGNIHETMFLQVSPSINGNTLNWNKYKGFKYFIHRIFKADSSNKFIEIASIDSATTNYFDPNGTVFSYYQIMVNNINFYERYSQSNISSSKTQTTGIKNDSNEGVYSIQPNPFNESLTLNNLSPNNREVVVMNSFGAIIQVLHLRAFKKMEVITRDYSPGLYFFKITDDEGTFTQKMLKIN